MIILSDVNTRLLGNRGQANIRSSKVQVKRKLDLLRKSLSHWNSLLKKTYNKNFDKRFSGASGGIGAGISAILNGSLHTGSDYIMKKTGMERQIRFSKYVILGEGTIDNTTLDKGILALAKEAKKKGKVIFGVFGDIKAEQKFLNKYFDYVINLSLLAKKKLYIKKLFQEKRRIFSF